MVPSFLIIFRESFEAVLVVGIVFGYLAKTGRTEHRPKVWLGIGSGIAASVLGAALFHLLAGGFEGKSEQLFEAATMLCGAILMTFAVRWMAEGGNLQRNLESSAGGSGWGFFLLVFVSILREGIEAVLFLAAARFASTNNDLAGAALGLAAALLLGWLLLRAAIRINMKVFFLVINILLVLFAAGLAARAAHELTEMGALPPIVERVWNINPEPRPDGTYPLFHDEGYIGSAVHGLFGYRGAPTLVELLAYAAYLAIVLPVWRRAVRRKNPKKQPAQTTRMSPGATSLTPTGNLITITAGGAHAREGKDDPQSHHDTP